MSFRFTSLAPGQCDCPGAREAIPKNIRKQITWIPAHLYMRARHACLLYCFRVFNYTPCINFVVVLLTYKMDLIAINKVIFLFHVYDCGLFSILRTVMMTSSNGSLFPFYWPITAPVTGEFPTQRPMTRSLAVFFDLRLNNRLSKQSRRRWLETPSRPLWCNCVLFIANRPSLCMEIA